MLKSLTAVALLALPIAAFAATDNYTVDPLHSSVNFTVDHLGLTNIYGRFTKFTAKYSMDKAAKTGAMEASVDTASVDTNENDKPLWVTLAQSWLQLAEDADRISSDVRNAELERAVEAALI